MSRCIDAQVSSLSIVSFVIDLEWWTLGSHVTWGLISPRQSQWISGMKVKATARVEDVLLCKRNAKREGSSGVFLRHRDLSFLRRMEKLLED